ncbi:hypothetical protein D3C79_641190 [compost metagenome]
MATGLEIQKVIHPRLCRAGFPLQIGDRRGRIVHRRHQSAPPNHDVLVKGVGPGKDVVRTYLAKGARVNPIQQLRVYCRRGLTQIFVGKARASFIELRPVSYQSSARLQATQDVDPGVKLVPCCPGIRRISSTKLGRIKAVQQRGICRLAIDRKILARQCNTALIKRRPRCAEHQVPTCVQTVIDVGTAIELSELRERVCQVPACKLR